MDDRVHSLELLKISLTSEKIARGKTGLYPAQQALLYNFIKNRRTIVSEYEIAYRPESDTPSERWAESRRASMRNLRKELNEWLSSLLTIPGVGAVIDQTDKFLVFVARFMTVAQLKKYPPSASATFFTGRPPDQDIFVLELRYFRPSKLPETLRDLRKFFLGERIGKKRYAHHLQYSHPEVEPRPAEKSPPFSLPPYLADGSPTNHTIQVQLPLEPASKDDLPSLFDSPTLPLRALPSPRVEHELALTKPLPPRMHHAGQKAWRPVQAAIVSTVMLLATFLRPGTQEWQQFSIPTFASKNPLAVRPAQPDNVGSKHPDTPQVTRKLSIQNSTDELSLSHSQLRTADESKPLQNQAHGVFTNQALYINLAKQIGTEPAKAAFRAAIKHFGKQTAIKCKRAHLSDVGFQGLTLSIVFDGCKQWAPAIITLADFSSGWTPTSVASVIQ